MTSFQLPSQEFTQRSEMQSQSLRQDSANQMVGGLTHQVEAMKQFALMKAESDAKLQMFQQEMDLNAVKLQHMQALDATDLMRHQVEAAKLQNDAMKLQLEDQKRRSEAWGKSPISEAQASVLKALGGGEGMAEIGYELGEGGTFNKLSPEKQKALLAAIKGRDGVNQDRLLADYYRNLGEDEIADQIDRRIAVNKNLPQPSHQISTAPKPLPPMDLAFKQREAPSMLALSNVTKDEQTQKKIIDLGRANAARWAAAKNSGRTENQKTPFTEKDAFDDFIQMVSNPRHPMHPQIMAWLAAQGDSDVGYIPTPGMPTR